MRLHADDDASPAVSTAEPRDGMGRPVRPLDALFAPRSIAVIGATDDAPSRGATVMTNLLESSGGATVYAVNPQRASVFGRRCYSSIADVPGGVDLAVVATNGATLPEVIDECLEARVKAAIALTAGARERGAAPTSDGVLARARERGLRILGPNSLGLMLPAAGLNATFAQTPARAGSVGFASQSVSLCASILDWSATQHFGFSAFISMGAMLDVDWADIIDYLGDDPRTKSIVLFIESIGDPRAFLSAARAVATSKPIIVIKAGSAPTARGAGASTGTLVDTDAVFAAALRRCGALRVETIEELFSMADVLAKQPRPKGNRLAIITNAGAPAALAADALLKGGGRAAEVDASTLERLDALLTSPPSHANPIDIHGDATVDDFATTLELLAADPANDGILVTFSPQGEAQATDVAQRLATFANPARKPILASWMGGAAVADGIELLQRAGIPTFAYPDGAARIFNLMWRYDARLRKLFETPTMPDVEQVPESRAVGTIFERARGDDRTCLTEAECRRLLAAYGIPSVPTLPAQTPEAARAAADELGHPVGMKLRFPNERASDGSNARGISDAAGAGGDACFTGVTIARTVEAPDDFDLLLASSVDPQFGPVIVFGDGRFAETLSDRSIGLPPLSETLARRMIERTRISKASAAGGSRELDCAALAQVLVRFSELIVDQPRIKELLIRPLLVTADGFAALDARAVLHSFDIPDRDLPRLAIRPYPAEYAGPVTLRDRTVLTVRPIRPEDERLLRSFHAKLSAETVYTRYLHPFRLSQRIAHERLSRGCVIDYLREMAVVALRTDGTEQEIVGVGRLLMERHRNEAEFALLIADDFQNRGLGGKMLRRLVEIGRKERIARIVGYILRSNAPMLKACRRLGFRHVHTTGDDVVESIIDL